MEYPRRPIPPVCRVRQQLDHKHLGDPEREVFEKVRAQNFGPRLKPGAVVAITAGSRGMGGLNALLRGIARAVRELGATPFIIPAMGSHAGATAVGQEKLLHCLGVDLGSVGAEIRATMETVPLGRSRSGAQAHFDRLAYEADGVIVLGRVKTHPESQEGLASGLLKMTTVGLGKQIGAQEAHSHGLWKSVEAVPELSLATGKILCGVAVVENAFRQPLAIEVVAPNYEAFAETDRRLLLLARKHLAKIPFEKLDLLVVDEIGKNISGSGMDVNVIGKWRVEGGERRPDFKRIVALSLTPESMGNSLGIGLADFTTCRLANEVDPRATHINLLTATEPGTRNTVEAAFPAALSCDREAIEVALYSTLVSNPRLARIKSTADLHEFSISESLLEEARAAGLEVLTGPEPLHFDARDNLF